MRRARRTRRSADAAAVQLAIAGGAAQFCGSLDACAAAGVDDVVVVTRGAADATALHGLHDMAGLRGVPLAGAQRRCGRINSRGVNKLSSRERSTTRSTPTARGRAPRRLAETTQHSQRHARPVAPHTFEQVAAARGKSFVDDRINKAEKKALQQAAEILQLRRDVEAVREKTAAAQAEAQKREGGGARIARAAALPRSRRRGGRGGAGGGARARARPAAAARRERGERRLERRVVEPRRLSAAAARLGAAAARLGGRPRRRRAADRGRPRCGGDATRRRRAPTRARSRRRASGRSG